MRGSLLWILAVVCLGVAASVGVALRLSRARTISRLREQLHEAHRSRMARSLRANGMITEMQRDVVSGDFQQAKEARKARRTLVHVKKQAESSLRATDRALELLDSCTGDSDSLTKELQEHRQAITVDLVKLSDDLRMVQRRIMKAANPDGDDDDDTDDGTEDDTDTATIPIPIPKASLGMRL